MDEKDQGREGRIHRQDRLLRPVHFQANPRLLSELREYMERLQAKMPGGVALTPPVSAGRFADMVVGMQPLPKHEEPPRKPPDITFSMYSNIMRGTK